MATLVDGKWKTTIGNQEFTADTQEDLAAQIESHAIEQNRLATERATEIEPDAPPVAPIVFKSRELSTDEMFQIGVELQDPSKAAAAMRKLNEAQFGQSMDKVVEGLNQSQVNSMKDDYAASTQRWMDEHPSYYPSGTNRVNMFRWLEDVEYRGIYKDKGFLPPTPRNLTLAFNALLERGTELELEPNEDSQEDGEAPRTVQPTVRVRPRGSVGGVRNGDTNGGTPPAPRPKWTKAECDRMSGAELALKIAKEPAFKKFIDNGYK